MRIAAEMCGTEIKIGQRRNIQNLDWQTHPALWENRDTCAVKALSHSCWKQDAPFAYDSIGCMI